MPLFKSEQALARLELPALRWISLLFAFFVGVAHLGFSGLAVGAEVTTKVEGLSSTVVVVGDIDTKTPAQITAAIRQLATERGHGVALNLALDSGGGDLEAAIAAGIVIRAHAVFTLVPEHAACASSCALLFLGGVHRSVLGRYGIHRPYADRYMESPADAQRFYERVNKVAGDYLQRMNVSSRFLEAMNVVSPGDMRWLTAAERRELGIEGSDPAWQENNDSAYAKRLGISKTELYERQQRANNKCSSPTPRLSSEESLLCTADMVDRGN